MKSFVIDNSIVMSWFFEEEHNKKSQEVLDQLSSNQACVPSLWPYELANALFVAEKTKGIKEADSTAFINDLKTLPIVIENNNFEGITKDILSISREHRITVYDACYVELALRKDLPLASFDKDVLAVCEKIGIKLLE